MTSRARLFAALLFAALAAILGWILSRTDTVSGLERASNSWAAASPTEAEDIDMFAIRVTELGLFPDAELRVDGETNPELTANTIESLAQAVSSPDMSALVRRDHSWRLHVFGQGGSQTSIKQVGDTLADGWIITDIQPTRVILRRGEEELRLEAFPAGEIDDDE